jgi:hypothetical protein
MVALRAAVHRGWWPCSLRLEPYSWQLGYVAAAAAAAAAPLSARRPHPPLCGFSCELGRGMSAWVRKLNIQGLMPGGGDGNGDGDDDSDDGDVFCSPSAAAGGGEQDFELDFGATSFGSPLSAQGSAGWDSGGGLSSGSSSATSPRARGGGGGDNLPLPSDDLLTARAVDLEDEQLKVSVSETTEGAVQLKDFDILHVVGKGGFGKVMQVKKIDDGQIFALKSMLKSHIVQCEEVDGVRTERRVLQQIRHPFIVRLHYAFQTAAKLCAHLLCHYCFGAMTRNTTRT